MTGELAGTLRERVTIEQREDARDALGAAVGNWLPNGEVWAAVVPDGTGNAVAGDVREAGHRWVVTVRTRDGIAPGDRLVWWGRLLTVTAVEHDPRQPDRMRIRALEQR